MPTATRVTASYSRHLLLLRRPEELALFCAYRY